MIYLQNIPHLPENIVKYYLLLQASTEIIPEIWNVSIFFSRMQHPLICKNIYPWALDEDIVNLVGKKSVKL